MEKLVYCNVCRSQSMLGSNVRLWMHDWLVSVISLMVSHCLWF